jgi:site-specific DNA-methyltransferase (adenine-specific)
LALAWENTPTMAKTISINIENKNFEEVITDIKIANGDCIELFKKIPSNSVHLVLTDPPYNLGEFMHKRNTNLAKMRENHFAYSGWDNLGYEEWEDSMDKFLQESSRVLKEKGTLLLFMSLMKVETIIRLAEKHNFYYKTIGVWHKTNPMPRNMNLHFVNSTECWLYFIHKGTTGTFNNNGVMMHDFIETSLTPQSEKKYGKHPTQKPLQLINHFVKTLSNKGEVILDPFMGSGSTGVSATLQQRQFLGIELDEKYFDIAKKRIKNSSI